MKSKSVLKAAHLKTIIQVHREDDVYIAVDFITNVADQGATEEEAVSNLKKGLEVTCTWLKT